MPRSEAGARRPSAKLRIGGRGSGSVKCARLAATCSGEAFGAARMLQDLLETHARLRVKLIFVRVEEVIVDAACEEGGNGEKFMCARTLPSIRGQNTPRRLAIRY